MVSLVFVLKAVNSSMNKSVALAKNIVIGWKARTKNLSSAGMTGKRTPTANESDDSDE